MLFYRLGSESCYPKAESTGKHSTLSCASHLSSRTNWRALGEYFKPVRCPKWMSEDEYKALPESIMVSPSWVSDHGARVPDAQVTLVTTLLDAEAYPADELAELYGTRWRVEEDLKSLKQTMKMDVLKCMTVDGVLKELR